MSDLFMYLLKVSAISSIFYSCYQLFLKRDTFFSANRHFLLAGLISAIVLPFLVFTKVTYIERPIIEANTISLSNVNFQTLDVVAQPSFEINWLAILAVIYVVGFFILISRFIFQLFALRRLTKNQPIVRKGQFNLITIDTEIAPFSFFNTIVYNPNLYSQEELEAIIEHEQVHCRQRHSLDMVLSELFLAFQWFNPLMWLYKRSIQQNLEFIADKEALASLNESKTYQQTLLKVSLGNYCTAVVNNFFNSLIKKRIVMINQQSSRKRNLFKMVFILPLLAVFLYSFNIEEETKFKPTMNETNAVSFISPIKASDLRNISSSFGMHKNPFTKQKEFHTGIDLVAPRGTKVLATASGTIKLAKKDGKHGNRVIIAHKDGFESAYSHLQKFNVSEGQQVKMGELIAFIGSTGLSTGPHLHFEVLKDGKQLDPTLIVRDFKGADKLNHYSITRTSTKQELRDIETEFNSLNQHVSISLNPEFEKTNNQIRKLTFTPLFKSESKSDTKVIIDFNKSKEFSFYYDSAQNGIVTKNGEEMGFLILPDRFTIPNSAKSPVQEKEEKMGENPLIILNGKVTKLKDKENEELHILGEVKMIKPSPAIKKYGQEAKDGALEVQGEIKFVSKKGFRIKITKNTSDEELEKLVNDIKLKNGHELEFNKVKRNSAGIIVSIAIKMKSNTSSVSSNESNSLGIKDIHLGINEDGGIYINSETEDEIEIDINKKIMIEEERKIDKSIEVIEENIKNEIEEDVEENEWKVSPAVIIKEVEYANKEALNDYKVKTAAISGLKFENKIQSVKYEFLFIIEKNSSDRYLNDMAKELKNTFGVDLKITKLKRNSNNEITRIRITLDDNDGNKSSATFIKGNNPVPNIAVGKENENLVIRSITEKNRPNTDYLYPSVQSFKIESKALHILDGKVISEKEFIKLDPTKIESMNVLKGKSATKLYGEKGKNGAVIVKSKKKK